MAEEEPQLKKFKHSFISDFIYSASFQKVFNDNWHNRTDIKLDNLEIISKPFRVCKISNFLCEKAIDKVETELMDVECTTNCMDLYQFEQTSDLANVDTENLKLLYQTFQTDLATWMERNTKIELNKKISMSSSCYYDTDYLLCHDDNMGDRRIAFILYLTRFWTATDGGALDLFDTDEHGLPRNVVKSLIPEYNSLVFFEVVDNSYHQVAEVTSSTKARWSINGWFHGPLRESTRPKRPEFQPSYVEPIETVVNLRDWIVECYLYPRIVEKIHQDMEKESFAFLADFLRDEVYKKLSADLSSSAIVWRKVGPADIRNYEVADEETLPELLKDFYNMFKSVSVFQLLKDYTELDLVAQQETMKPKMTIELQRWSKGCYTLISDKNATPTANERRSDDNGCADLTEESQERSSERFNDIIKNGHDYSAQDHGNKSAESGCDTPASAKESEEIDEEEILKKTIKGKSPRSKKTHPPQQSTSSSKCENLSPQKSFRVLDTDDSDVSDIGDYLSDPLDCSLECSDREEDLDDGNPSEPGSLDVFVQFHTCSVPEEYTIDYVDPREQEGALIHIPAKDNHLCLVYKTLGTCRVQKYVNHYCTDYFYNLICTYYE